MDKVLTEVGFNDATEDDDRDLADDTEHASCLLAVSCFLADLGEDVPKDNEPREMPKNEGPGQPKEPKEHKVPKR